MFVAGHPERARSLGILGQKAELTGVSADWAGLLDLTAQILAVGSLLFFSFVATWVFGREFADRTAHYLMALPVSRTSVVAAKFALVGAWCAALTLWLVLQSLAVGWAMDLPGWSADAARTGVLDALLAGVLMILAIAPVALVASAGRGYLAALATALGLLVTAQLAAVFGLGALVPWSAPAVAAGLAPGQVLAAPGVVACLATGALGVLGTIRWWNGADAGA
jgi:ABC-2 type transport system permease protein